MQVTVQEARTKLSRLIRAALSGEEVIIARGSTPVVRLVPMEKKKRFKFGILKRELRSTTPDFIWSPCPRASWTHGRAVEWAWRSWMRGHA